MARQQTGKITRSLRIDPDLYAEAQKVPIDDKRVADFSDYVSQLITKDLARRDKAALRRGKA